MWDQFRAAIRLQAIVTAAAVLLSGWLAGAHGAVSALLGGSIGIAGSLAFARIATRSKAKSADDVLISALKAEGVKLSLMIVLLVVVLMGYRDAVVAAVVGSFVASAVVFGMGAFARSNQIEQKT
jgi:ATP synthase protein I